MKGDWFYFVIILPLVLIIAYCGALLAYIGLGEILLAFAKAMGWVKKNGKEK